MKEIIEFLAGNGIQYFATVGLDGNAKVRPFQMMFEQDGKIYYCTGSQKEVYKELELNSHFEICVSTLDRWLRISGRAQFIDNPQIKEKIIEISPLVKSIYKSADNSDLKVFYIADGEATLMDFSGRQPKRIKL